MKYQLFQTELLIQVPLTDEDYDILVVFAERLGPDYCIFSFNYRFGSLADNDRSRFHVFKTEGLGKLSLVEQVKRKINLACTLGKDQETGIVY